MDQELLSFRVSNAMLMEFTTYERRGEKRDVPFAFALASRLLLVFIVILH
jgi:hypothetical protein